MKPATLARALVAGALGLLVSAGVLSPVSAATKPTIVVNPLLTPAQPAVTITDQNGIDSSAAPTLAIKGTLPDGKTNVNVTTTWRQISATQVQAFLDPTSYTGTNGSPFPSYVPTLTYSVRTNSNCSAYCLNGVTTVTAVGSVTWLDQLLAQANYLPFTFTASVSFGTPLATPVAGTLARKFGGLPATFWTLWNPTAQNVIVKGAVMKFQDEHGAAPSGVPSAYVWRTLMAMVNSGVSTSSTYNYVDVNGKIPQRVHLYINGTYAFSVPANLGISVAPTPRETNPVYQRYATQTMKGTNPDGTKYNDPGIPWISYFNGGVALHGFHRRTYGTPQSLGCVEMTYTDAGRIWPYTPVGTLVTVR